MSLVPAIVLTLGGGALSSPAHADARTWSDPLTVAGGPTNSATNNSLTGFDQVISDRSGRLWLYTVNDYSSASQTADVTLTPFTGAGSLGAPQTLPPDPHFGRDVAALGPVSFLPNGGAVLSWSPAGGGELSLVYRSPSGVFGPVLQASGIDSFSAAGNEVLTVGGGKVTSYAIGAGGTLTPGASQTLESNTSQVDQVALDDAGTADLLVGAYDQNYALVLTEYSRSATGAWGSAVNVATNGAGPAVVTAPGGRELLVEDNSATYSNVTVYASVRSPGGTFAPPSQLLNMTGPSYPGYYSASFSSEHLAAGGDGTLAVGGIAETCASDRSQSSTGDGEAWVIAPGSTTPVQEPIPGTTVSLHTQSRLTTLGAGDGQVDAGVVTSTDSRSTLGAGCQNMPAPLQTGDTDTTSDTAVVVGEGSRTYASLTTTYKSSGGQYGSFLAVGAIGEDANGNAAAFGSLSADNSSEAATYGAPATTVTPTPPIPPATSPTPPATTPVLASPTTQPSASLPSTSQQPKAPAPKASSVQILPGGDLSLTITDTSSLPETMQLLLQSFSSSAQGHLVSTPLVTLPTGHVLITVTKHLKAHQKVLFRLHLGSAARSYLHKHSRAKARLLLVTSAIGHLTVVRTIGLTLKTRN